jgi:hypothetical protein
VASSQAGPSSFAGASGTKVPKTSILVVGGTGTLGRQIVRKALDEGYDVRCLVRPRFNPADFLREWGATVVQVSMHLLHAILLTNAYLEPLMADEAPMCRILFIHAVSIAFVSLSLFPCYQTHQHAAVCFGLEMLLHQEPNAHCAQVPEQVPDDYAPLRGWENSALQGTFRPDLGPLFLRSSILPPN